MKRFLTRILYFLIPLLLVAVSLEISIRNIDSYYKQKIDGLLEYSDSIEILILGSSHAAEGISPNVFDLFAYNMAFGSQTLYFDERITVKHLEKLSKLKYVLISVDYQSLYYTHNQDRDIFYHFYYGIDYEDNTYFASDISRFFFGFKPETAIKQLTSTVDKLEKGYFSNDTTYYNSFEAEVVKKRHDHFKYIIESNRDYKEIILNDLDQFIGVLKNKDIVPIIITMPLHESYYNLLDKEIVKQNYADIVLLCDKYQIEHWQYLNEEFLDSEYLDNSHLNRSGAERLARLLNERIISLNDDDPENRSIQ